MSVTTNPIVANPNGSSGTAGAIAILENGGPIASNVTTLNFQAATLVEDIGGGQVNVDVYSPTTVTVYENTVSKSTNVDKIDFVGAVVTIPGTDDYVTVTIPDTDLGYTASTRVLTSSNGSDVTLPLVSSSDAGLAPSSGGGTTNFLRADGTWVTPPGSGSTNLGYTAATRILTSDTGTDVTLPLVSSGDAGLAPASGGGTSNYLRADGTWTAPPGGGATNLSYTAATRVLASDTGTDATLPLVSSGDAGLAPSSGGGTTNYLRADGTWQAPPGGSAPAIKDEGTTVVATPSAINFVGAGVSAVDGGGGTATITIPGGGGGSYVGDYASAAALQSGAPAASNDGNIGTVTNSLYMSDGVAWRPMVTYVSSLAYAEGSPLPATYTQAQLDALLLGRGNVISRASRPIIRPSSGSSNATGLITMSTGLNASWTIPGSSMPCWIYLPANVVTGIAVAQLHAGVITAATTVQLNGSPTTANTSYTTDSSSYLPLHSFTLTGNEFGSNGELEIVVKSTHAGTMTSAHEIQFQIGGTSFGGTSNNTSSYISRVSTGRLIGRGKDAASQIGMWDSTAGSTANTALDTISTFLTVDTTTNQTVSVRVKAPVGSTIVLDMVRATLWKS